MNSTGAALATEPAGRPRRRTQQERSDATRARLLDAAVACLSEHGYAGTTTALVCEKAGFTRGAQLHHYPTKALLMDAAVRALSDRAVDAFDRSLSRAVGRRDRLAAFLDGIWRTLDGPLFRVSLDVLVAARTDECLRRAVLTGLDRLSVVIEERVSKVAEAVRPNDPRPLADLLHLSVHLVHGFGLDGMLAPRPERARRLYEAWKRQVEEASGRVPG